jgi:hypothetical protein
VKDKLKKIKGSTAYKELIFLGNAIEGSADTSV